MTHRILTLFFLFLTIGLQAQYERGNWYLSGKTAITEGNQSTVAGSESLTNPAGRAGYFILDHLLVGGNPLNPAAFVRYYQPLKKKKECRLAAFAEFNVSAILNRRGTVTLSPAIGLEYQLSPGILLSATVQQSYERLINSTSLQFGINTVIGRSGLEPGQDFLRKGTLFIDPNIGQASFGTIELTDFDINTFSFSLHVGGGLMLTDRFSFDGSVSASNYRSEYESPDFGSPSGVELAADLGLRFFVTGTGKFRPYVGVGINGRYRLEEVDLESLGRVDFREELFELTPYLKLGALFFLSEKVALDAGVEYNFRDTDNSQLIDSRLGLGAGVKIFLTRE